MKLGETEDLCPVRTKGHGDTNLLTRVDYLTPRYFRLERLLRVGRGTWGTTDPRPPQCLLLGPRTNNTPSLIGRWRCWDYSLSFVDTSNSTTYRRHNNDVVGTGRTRLSVSSNPCFLSGPHKDLVRHSPYVHVLTCTLTHTLSRTHSHTYMYTHVLTHVH